MPKRKFQSQHDSSFHLPQSSDFWSNTVLHHLNTDDHPNLALSCSFFYNQVNQFAANKLLHLLRTQTRPFSEAESRDIVNRLSSPRKAYSAYRKLMAFPAMVLQTDLLQTLQNNRHSELTWSLLDDNVPAFIQALPPHTPALQFLPAAVALGSIDLIGYLLHEYYQEITLDKIRYLVEVTLRTAQPTLLDFFLNLANIVFRSPITLDEYSFLLAIESKNISMVDTVLSLTSLPQLHIANSMLWMNTIPYVAVLSGVISIVERLNQLYEQVDSMLVFTQELLAAAVESGNPKMVGYVTPKLEPGALDLVFYRELMDLAITTRNLQMVEVLHKSFIQLGLMPRRTEHLLIRLIKGGSPPIFDLIFKQYALAEYFQKTYTNIYFSAAISSGEVVMVRHIIAFLNERGCSPIIYNDMLDQAAINPEMYQLVRQLAQQQGMSHHPKEIALMHAIHSYDVTLVQHIITCMNSVKLPVMNKQLFQAIYHLSLFSALPCIQSLFASYCQLPHLEPLLVHLNNPFLTQYVKNITQAAKPLCLVSMKNC